MGALSDVSRRALNVYERTVSMRDIVYIFALFNPNSRSSKWNPNADIDDEGKVDVEGISIVARNSGKHDTKRS